jgi:hypothetical protein
MLQRHENFLATSVAKSQDFCAAASEPRDGSVFQAATARNRL